MSLTRYPEGSLKELCQIAFPLMLSSLSVTTMVLIDRLLLAHYSSMALNAVANAMTLGWAYLYSWMILTSIAEVFVAQYNGAKQFNKLGEPVWQMIWLSLASVLFFAPLALGVDIWFFRGDDYQLERDYLKWMLWFGPTLPLYGALCSFFIGQGKIQLITSVAIVANLVNAALDYVLIFGYGNLIPSMGVKGAAIATSGSAVFQILVLAIVFLKRSNRLDFGTGRFALRFNLLWQCVRIGFPGAIFVAIELIAWSIFYRMMSKLGNHHMTVASISQSIVIFFYFFADAISKAISAITGNLIGAQRFSFIPNVIYSGLLLNLFFFFLLAIFFYLFSDTATLYFLPNASTIEFETLKESIRFCLLSLSFYLLFEGIRLVFAGVLTAAGDTFFLLISGTLSVWLFLVAPVYFWVLLGKRSVELAYLFCIFYSMSAGFFYFYRFWSGAWKPNSLIAIGKPHFIE